MITQFEGETRMDAIVNHFSLDIDDETEFFQYIADMGYTVDAEDEIIEALFKDFNENR